MNHTFERPYSQLGSRASRGLSLTRRLRQRAVLQRQQSAQVSAASPDAASPTSSSPTPVAALNRGMQGQQGPVPFASQVAAHLGVDLAHIRCFFGPEAQAACDMVGAEAFTVGDVIVFGTASPSLELVLHEVTHVIQQGGDTGEGHVGSVSSSLSMTDAGHQTEQEADRVSRGGRLENGQGTQTLACDGPVLARVQATRAHGVWLVSDPSQYQNTILHRLPLGTRVVITDRGAGRPFNRTTPEYQWVQVRVSTGALMGTTGWVMSTLLHEIGETQQVSMTEARRLFQELAGASFVTTSGQTAPIPFHYPPDGCYARAHLMERLLTEKGYASRKVFAVSRTAQGGAGLHVPTPNAGDVAAPGQTPTVSWWYHVAPVISVRQDDGSVAEMVMDPSMTSGPVPISTWTGMMSGQAFTRLTVAQVGQLVQNNGGQFPNGQSVVYTTDRNAYGPHDYNATTPAQGDAAHQSWGAQAVSGYATQNAPAHRLASAIRREMSRSGGQVNVARIVAAIRAAPANARAGLRAQFPTLIRELELARDAGRMTAAQHTQITTELNR